MVIIKDSLLLRLKRVREKEKETSDSKIIKIHDLIVDF
jgi:hypothetical protein